MTPLSQQLRAIAARAPALDRPAIAAAADAVEQLAQARAERYAAVALLADVTKALGDLSFECDGLTRCNTPSVATYNRTFQVLLDARAAIAAAGIVIAACPLIARIAEFCAMLFIVVVLLVTSLFVRDDATEKGTR